MSEAKTFDWPLCTEAENFLDQKLHFFFEKNSFAKKLAQRMHDEAGNVFYEWVDYLVLSEKEEFKLKEFGFEVEHDMETPGGELIYYHPKAMMPRVMISKDKSHGEVPSIVAIRPEFLEDFAKAHDLGSMMHGEPLSRYRWMSVSKENGTELLAVQRLAYRGFTCKQMEPGESAKVLKAREFWMTRKRHFKNDDDGVKEAFHMLDQSFELIGRDRTCHFFFEAERVFWQRRNRAARVQHERQQVLGLGWGNHDHHTFRCSREYFVDLINFLVKLGFEKRERYYAGAEAGWGAQISEHFITSIVVFADVDLFPEETEIDFSTQRLSSPNKLGTVGMWTGLHGDSFLQAGMHHLEARFNFEVLRDQLAQEQVETMKPFSYFDFLKQAFTKGERWQVLPERVARLLEKKLITQEQADKFLSEGAIGSHMENLQRKGGYKGFNQKSVSVIISATDPRKTESH